MKLARSTPSRRLAVLAPLAGVLIVSVGCDEKGGMDDGMADDAADDAAEDSADDGGTEAGDDEGTMEARCASEDRDDEFALGLAHDGAAVRMMIADADPAIPIRGDNSWTIQIVDDSGAAMDGMELSISPWMPDHGHGTPVKSTITALENGEYEIAPINLFMAGYWEVTISTAEPEDSVVFKVCVE